MLNFIYNHTFTIEGLITVIILVSLIGVIIDDWRVKRWRQKRKDEHAEMVDALKEEDHD
jgi:hypothetical protein